MHLERQVCCNHCCPCFVLSSFTCIHMHASMHAVPCVTVLSNVSFDSMGDGIADNAEQLAPTRPPPNPCPQSNNYARERGTERLPGDLVPAFYLGRGGGSEPIAAAQHREPNARAQYGTSVAAHRNWWPKYVKKCSVQHSKRVTA